MAEKTTGDKELVRAKCRLLRNRLGDANLKKVRIAEMRQANEREINEITAGFRELRPECEHERHALLGECKHCLMPMPK